jgi:hypothetical protein
MNNPTAPLRLLFIAAAAICVLDMLWAALGHSAIYLGLWWWSFIKSSLIYGHALFVVTWLILLVFAVKLWRFRGLWLLLTPVIFFPVTWLVLFFFACGFGECV